MLLRFKNIQQLVTLSITSGTINVSANKELLTTLLYTDFWPAAIPPHLLINSPAAQIARAHHIISYTNLKPNQRFLDFGCGVSGCSLAAQQRGAGFSLSYDPVTKNEHTTNDIDVVHYNAPYDIILFYDVIDHLEPDTQPSILQSLGDLLSPDGLIYMRCHPWCGSHGAHQYNAFNKAFVHLLYDKSELPIDVLIDAPLTKVINVAIYDDWIKAAGLTIVDKKVISSPIPEFFNDEFIKQSILQKWPLDQYNMSVEFIDYIIKNG